MSHINHLLKTSLESVDLEKTEELSDVELLESHQQLEQDHDSFQSLIQSSEALAALHHTPDSVFKAISVESIGLESDDKQSIFLRVYNAIKQFLATIWKNIKIAFANLSRMCSILLLKLTRNKEKLKELKLKNTEIIFSTAMLEQHGAIREEHGQTTFYFISNDALPSKVKLTELIHSFSEDAKRLHENFNKELADFIRTNDIDDLYSSVKGYLSTANHSLRVRPAGEFSFSYDDIIELADVYDKGIFSHVSDTGAGDFDNTEKKFQAILERFKKDKDTKVIKKFGEFVHAYSKFNLNRLNYKAYLKKGAQTVNKVMEKIIAHHSK